MNDDTTDRILYALFCLSRDTCVIDATELARTVEVTPTQAAIALVDLERAGLVDATRARLTMRGLARAASLDAGGAGHGGPAVDLRHRRPSLQAILPRPGIAADSPAQHHARVPNQAESAASSGPKRLRTRRPAPESRARARAQDQERSARH